MVKRRQLILGAGAATALAALPLVGVAQTLPYSTNWMSLLPASAQRTTGNPFGECGEAATWYAADLRNVIQGGAFVQTSALASYVQDHSLPAPSVFMTCREDLWPFSNWPGFPAPSAAAVADYANHVIPNGLVLKDFFQGVNTVDEYIAYCKTEIANGYPIILPTEGGAHVIFFGDYDDGISSFIGWDAAATSPGYSLLNYGALTLAVGECFSVRNVIYNQGGNTQMLLDQYKADVNALVLGQITTAELSAIDALRAQIFPDAGQSSNPGTTITPGNGAMTDGAQGVWTIGTAPEGDLRLGNISTGEWASSATILPNGQVQIVEQGTGYKRCTPPGVAQWSNC
jgi:hypothetical protein